MLMCSRCHKRPAVVFISQGNGAGDTQGLCLVCAKELGIKPVNDLMEKMGITEEQLESMAEEMEGLMALNPENEEGSSDEEDGFTPGGAATFPSFLQNVFPDMGQKPSGENGAAAKAPEREKKAPKKNKRKAHFRLLHRFDRPGPEWGTGCHYRTGAGNRSGHSDPFPQNQK